MAIKSNVNFKHWNGTDYDIYYFTTTAGAVKETSDRWFVKPTMTINGKVFASNKAFVLSGADIQIGTGTYPEQIIPSGTSLADAIQSLQASFNEFSSRELYSDDVTLSGSPNLTSWAGQNVTYALDQLVQRTKSLEENKLDGKGGVVSGNLTVNGNFTVAGTTTIVNSTNLEIADQVLVLAKGNTKPLTNPAGFVVPKYDGTNYGGIFFDSEGWAYVGDVAIDETGNIDMADEATTAQKLACISDDNANLSTDVLYLYNPTKKAFVKTTAKIITDVTQVTQANYANIPTLGAIKEKLIFSQKTQDNKNEEVTMHSVELYNLAGNSWIPIVNRVGSVVIAKETEPAYTPKEVGDIWIDTSEATEVI